MSGEEKVMTFLHAMTNAGEADFQKQVAEAVNKGEIHMDYATAILINQMIVKAKAEERERCAAQVEDCVACCEECDAPRRIAACLRKGPNVLYVRQV